MPLFETGDQGLGPDVSRVLISSKSSFRKTTNYRAEIQAASLLRRPHAYIKYKQSQLVYYQSH